MAGSDTESPDLTAGSGRERGGGGGLGRVSAPLLGPNPSEPGLSASDKDKESILQAAPPQTVPAAAAHAARGWGEGGGGLACALGVATFMGLLQTPFFTESLSKGPGTAVPTVWEFGKS